MFGLDQNPPKCRFALLTQYELTHTHTHIKTCFFFAYLRFLMFNLTCRRRIRRQGLKIESIRMDFRYIYTFIRRNDTNRVFFFFFNFSNLTSVNVTTNTYVLFYGSITDRNWISAEPYGLVIEIPS